MDWLARHSQEDPTSVKIRALQRIRGLGGEVLVLTADVSDADHMHRAIQTASRRFGTIHGVIHGAARLGEGAFAPLIEIDREDCERQFQPKVLRGFHLDFCVLLSSLSAVLGGLRYSAYAAANISMDTFARAQAQMGRSAWIP